MTKFNVIFDKTKDFDTFISNIIQTNAVLLQAFKSLGVITIESETTTFASVDGVLSYEIEQEIIATEHWHLQRITTRELPLKPYYTPENFGDNTCVYLVDSGVNTLHEEFTDANISNLWSWDGSFDDSTGHGTSVASVIIGKTLGVAKNATLKCVKIPFGVSVTTSVLLNAFDEILNDHLQTGGVKVINCSWTIPKNNILDSKITELQNQGLVVVAAAGNNVVNADTLSPVGLDSVIGVAASDTYDRVVNWATGLGSNWGPEVDITAPGINVEVAALQGGTEIKSGTSIAAGVVSGAVCQLINKNPGMSAADIQNSLITQSSDDLLFRNETIYGTTPNVLLFTISTQIFLTPDSTNRKIPVQKGTTVSIPITHISLIQTLNIHDILFGGKSRTSPEWVTLDNGSIIVNPPQTVDTKNYKITVEGLDSNNQRVSLLMLLLQVYDTDVSEIINETAEHYFYTSSETAQITLVAANCTGTCNFAGDCSGKNCGCFGGGTSTVGNCYTPGT